MLELMLALSVTALVAGAVSGMLRAVSTGVSTRQDNREVMIRAAAAQARLNAYVVPARCLLATSSGEVVLWLEDARQGGTIHATEIRWLRYDVRASRLDMFFVTFPDSFTQVMCELNDGIFAKDSDWDTVFDAYESQGWMSGYTLIDGVGGLTVSTDKVSPMESRHVYFDVDMLTDAGVTAVQTTASIRDHALPVS